MSSVLFKPYKINEDLTLKNRVVLAPLTRARCVGNIPGLPHHVEYYVQRASAGLIITEGTAISIQGDGWDQCAHIYAPEHVEGWKKVTSAVHEEGGAIFVQLWHTGRVSHSSFHGLQPVGPSAIAANGIAHAKDGLKAPYEVPRALDIEEIPKIVEEYRHAAQSAKDAGFDGVEIHAANGYLLDQFIQSHSNQRTDKYGGSHENRARLLNEVIDAVLTVWPSSKIGVRINPNGNFNDMGATDYYETFAYVLKQLDKRNLAYAHVMDGVAFGFHGHGEPFRIADVRKFYNGTLLANCGYSKDKAEGVLETGTVDLVAFGRVFISNPDFVLRIKNNWPLADPAPFSSFYEYPGEDPAVGYTDFPLYSA